VKQSFSGPCGAPLPVASGSQFRAILQKHSGTLSVSGDSPSRYGLEGGLHPTSGKPMPVAWVEIKKSYVSFHLMPIYGCSKLRDAMSTTQRRGV